MRAKAHGETEANTSSFHVPLFLVWILLIIIFIFLTLPEHSTHPILLTLGHTLPVTFTVRGDRFLIKRITRDTSSCILFFSSPLFSLQVSRKTLELAIERVIEVVHLKSRM